MIRRHDITSGEISRYCLNVHIISVSIVRSSKSRRTPTQLLLGGFVISHKVPAIKVRYQLQRELDLSRQFEELQRGVQFNEYPGISVLKPHVYGTVTSQVRKAIINFLLRSFDVSADEAALLLPEKVSQWGKISFVDEGDTIRCREPVQHSERNMTRDASFLKNHNHRRERRAVHGQLLRIIEFDAGFPRAAPHHLLLAVIHPVQALYYKSNPNTPYYQEEKFKPLEVVDVDDMSCLVARVPDRYHETGPRLWALCECPDTMGAGADEES
ncbi:hypothetical protein GGX14DRAFT_407771 [Mycena pura]|uniref:Uncharacterized protein n=1 Tax=Mycena pura TaxID=153505 RepID=A0AAD6UP49_9AGAR|nr:hypothetical protein GGX14DRAFT_407771 [Mycena pura]